MCIYSIATHVLDAIYKVSINGYQKSYSFSGRVFAHVLGHALGMAHDHTSFVCNDTSANRNCTKTDRKASDGSSCFNVKGIMSYIENPTTWSQCSTENFQRYVSKDGSFCLSDQCMHYPGDDNQGKGSENNDENVSEDGTNEGNNSYNIVKVNAKLRNV